MLGASIRRTGFWCLDAVRGGKLRTTYKNILNAESSAVRTEDQLRHILEYAVKQVPFYREMAPKTLQEFPVMTKWEYKRLGVERFLSDEYLGTRLHHVYTSGSTGTPFEVVQDSIKRNRVICDLIRCNEKIGWQLGDKFVFIRNWVSSYRQSPLKSILQNVHNVTVMEFDDRAKDKLLSYLQKNRGVNILGYASAVVDFCNYLKLRRLDGASLGIHLIVCDSDELSHADREKLEEYFNVPVFNRYDNEENGFIGISRAHEDRIYLNTNSLYFEILSPHGQEPVKPGEIGRVVVTDLYNHAMPLIRYDLGDLAVSNDRPDRIRTLEHFSGRSSGCLLDTKGKLIGNASISAALGPFTGITRYQVCQETENSYEIRYVGDLPAEEKQELLKRMKDCMGQDARISIQKVETIELGKNGKHSPTVKLDFS